MINVDPLQQVHVFTVSNFETPKSKFYLHTFYAVEFHQWNFTKYVAGTNLASNGRVLGPNQISHNTMTKA